MRFRIAGSGLGDCSDSPASNTICLYLSIAAEVGPGLFCVNVLLTIGLSFGVGRKTGGRTHVRKTAGHTVGSHLSISVLAGFGRISRRRLGSDGVRTTEAPRPSTRTGWWPPGSPAAGGAARPGW